MASTDREVLLVLYASTEGPNWRKKTTSDIDADLSECYGVEINNPGCVGKLNLGKNDLQGTKVFRRLHTAVLPR